MESINNEIELMEEVAGWLKNWAAKAPQANNETAFISHRNELVTINRKIDKVLMYLRFHRPDLAKAIEEKWRGLVNMALADFPNKSDLNETTILAAIGHASILGDTLHDVAEMAKSKFQNKEKPKLKLTVARIFKKIPYLIYALVLFLAALLGIFYYLGRLDQFKAIIYRTLQSK
jgi:hypothetical protein